MISLDKYIKVEIDNSTRIVSSRREFRCVFSRFVSFITRGILEMKLHNVMCDRKHLYESQSVQLREKNRYRMMPS